MAATNDTIDGLLAEFRGYSAGMPASYHVTMSWADFRKMLDRFDAAYKREVREAEDLFRKSLKKQEDTLRDQYEALVGFSNAAKLREALKAIGGLCDRLIPTWDGAIGRIKDVTEAALAAPPRNCDVMDWRTAWKIWREKFHPETPAGYSAAVKGTEAFMDWFAAPATEKEGGAK